MHRSKQPLYSIISSAVASSVVGTSRPSDLAVLKSILAKSSNLRVWLVRVFAETVPRHLHKNCNTTLPDLDSTMVLIWACI
jgi:hypothetical protein